MDTDHMLSMLQIEESEEERKNLGWKLSQAIEHGHPIPKGLPQEKGKALCSIILLVLKEPPS